MITLTGWSWTVILYKVLVTYQSWWPLTLTFGYIIDFIKPIACPAFDIWYVGRIHEGDVSRIKFGGLDFWLQGKIIDFKLARSLTYDGHVETCFSMLKQFPLSFVDSGLNIQKGFLLGTWWYLFITEGMITTFSAGALKFHIAGTVVWYPVRSHYSGNWSTIFCDELLFICRAFEKGALTTNLKSLVWLCR